MEDGISDQRGGAAKKDVTVLESNLKSKLTGCSRRTEATSISN
jgi:hypothetical protein